MITGVKLKSCVSDAQHYVGKHVASSLDHKDELCMYVISDIRQAMEGYTESNQARDMSIEGIYR